MQANTNLFKNVLYMNNIRYIDLLSININGSENVILETMDWNIPVCVIIIKINHELDDYKNDLIKYILETNKFTYYSIIDNYEIWVNLDNKDNKNIDKNIMKQNLIKSSLNIDENDKIIISSNIDHVKIDVGLSYGAPMTQKWIVTEKNLLVFCFEPNPMAVKRLLDPENKKDNPNNGDLLEHKFINTSAFIIPMALSNNENIEYLDFYIPEGDQGCASLHPPK